MAMQLTLPTDVEALVQKQLASGAFTTAEDVVGRALEMLDAEVNFTAEERQSLDSKIDCGLGQVAARKTYGPEQTRQKLAAMRRTHLDALDQ